MRKNKSKSEALASLGIGLWKSLQLLLALGFLLGAWLVLPGLGSQAQAEPWLSTRYAQNCAGCHSPGRKNLPAPDRRCTLSCQGCHVNPNGGGLRSFYGKWNEDRWLRSFRTSVLADKYSVAPTEKQHYADDKEAERDKNKDKEKDRESKDEHGRTKRGHKKVVNRRSKQGPGVDGFPLVEMASTDVNEKLYLRDGREFQIADRADWIYQVPKGDPYRLVDMVKADAGGDIRWEATQLSTNGGKASFHKFLMDGDFGVEARPLYRHLHLVYEARIKGSPTTWGNTLFTGQTRSLYAMVDDLPFNTFVMGGYYRPLFGNFVPDHYALAQEMTSFAMSGSTKNYDLLYDALSIGTAPNVPYMNVHVIRKKIGDLNDKTQGFATNLGLRFVTLGASLNYSYWRTNDARADGTKTGVEMHSIGAAAHYGKLTAGLDAVSMARDVSTQDFRQGGVYTLDTYTQIWRENYFTLMVAKANTNSVLLPGSANQIKAGVRGFLTPGVDLSFTYDSTEEKTDKDGSDNKVKGYESQLHLFF